MGPDTPVYTPEVYAWAGSKSKPHCRHFCTCLVSNRESQPRPAPIISGHVCGAGLRLLGMHLLCFCVYACAGSCWLVCDRAQVPRNAAPLTYAMSCLGSCFCFLGGTTPVFACKLRAVLTAGEVGQSGPTEVPLPYNFTPNLLNSWGGGPWLGSWPRLFAPTRCMLGPAEIASQTAGMLHVFGV